MARCDIHVLGSRTGYTTLEASAGVSGQERSELEQLHFGEVGTKEAAERLRRDPAMAGFPLRSGRFAISRMLPSDALDDVGRPTVEVVTLVIDSEGYARIAGALAQLAADIEWWNRARAEVSQGIDLPEAVGAASPQDAALQSLLDLWLAVRASRGSVVGVLPASDASRLLALVGVLDPVDRRALRWGVGMRGVSNRVDLCALAPEGSPHGARSVLRPAVRPGWHKRREMEYVEVRATSGCATFAPVTEIESMAAAPEKAASAVGETDASTRTYAPPSRRRGRLTARRTAIGSSVLSTCLLLLVLVMQNRQLKTEQLPDGVVAPQVESGQEADASPEPGPRNPRSGFGLNPDSNASESDSTGESSSVAGDGSAGANGVGGATGASKPVESTEREESDESAEEVDERTSGEGSDPAKQDVSTRSSEDGSTSQEAGNPPTEAIFPVKPAETKDPPGNPDGSREDKPKEEPPGATNSASDSGEDTVVMSTSSAQDPVVPRLEALRDALQDVLARFPTRKDESTWMPGAGAAALYETNAWIRSTVENSNRRRPRTDTYYLDKAREEARANGWPESRAVELSLEQLLPPLVRSFNELLRESKSREGKSPPLAIEDLGEVPGFDQLCGLWSGMPFMQAVREAGDGWEFFIETKDDRPCSPAALVVWLECLERLGKIQEKMKKAGNDGVADERIAQEVWGATEYPNLLALGDAKRSGRWVRERLKSMGWVEPGGGLR